MGLLSLLARPLLVAKLLPIELWRECDLDETAGRPGRGCSVGEPCGEPDLLAGAERELLRALFLWSP